MSKQSDKPKLKNILQIWSTCILKKRQIVKENWKLKKSFQE